MTNTILDKIERLHYYGWGMNEDPKDVPLESAFIIRDQVIDILKEGVYTKEEMEKAIKDTLTATIAGMMDWFQKETFVKDKNGNTIPDAVIDVDKKTSKALRKYVDEKLKEKRISFIWGETKENKEPKMNYWGASQADIDAYTKDLEDWKQNQSNQKP